MIACWLGWTYLHALNIVNTGFVQMPDSIMRQADDRVIHAPGHLSKTLGLCVFLEAEGREVDAGSEYTGLGQNADTSYSINLHLHIWISVGVSQVSQVGPPCRILGVSFNNDGVLVQGIRQGQSSLRLLP